MTTHKLDTRRIARHLSEGMKWRCLPGDYEFDEPFVLPKGTGHSIIGAGHGQTSNNDSPVSRLVWRGDPREPAIIVNGVYQQLRNFSLHGGGILVTKDGTGVGTGKMVIDDVFIHGAEVGLQFGQQEGEHNCDESSIGTITFERCKTAVKLKNTQSMGHVFTRLRSRYCGKTFEICGGGNVAVLSGFSVGSGAWFHFSSENSPKRQPAVNNGMFTCNNLVVDRSSGTEFRLVDMDKWVEMSPHVVCMFRDGHIKFREYSPGEPVAHMRGPMTLKLENSKVHEHFRCLPDSKGRRPSVVIDGMDADALANA